MCAAGRRDRCGYLLSVTPNTHRLFRHKPIAAALLLASTGMAGCLETAPTGPGDTPMVDDANAGGPPSVDNISISGGQTSGAGQNGGQTFDAGVSGTGGVGGTGTGGVGGTGTGGFGGTGNGGFGATGNDGFGATGNGGVAGQGVAGFGGTGFTGNGTGTGTGFGTGFGSAFGGTGFGSIPNNTTTPFPGLNTPPVPSFRATPQCLPQEQTEVQLASTSIDADGDPLICEWTAPEINITSDSGCVISGSAFSNAGAIQIELTVTDSNGASATAVGTLLRCPPTL
jgi:hypothetical protein